MRRTARNATAQRKKYSNYSNSKTEVMRWQRAPPLPTHLLGWPSENPTRLLVRGFKSQTNKLGAGEVLVAVVDYTLR